VEKLRCFELLVWEASPIIFLSGEFKLCPMANVNRMTGEKLRKVVVCVGVEDERKAVSLIHICQETGCKFLDSADIALSTSCTT
jgi:hypothetical protein